MGNLDPRSRICLASSNPVRFVDLYGLWYCEGKPDCEKWVEDALTRLKGSGETGTKLVDFFDAYDHDLKQQQEGQVEDYYVNDCDEIVPKGLVIQFGDGVSGKANTIDSKKLQINDYQDGIAPYYYPNDFGVATFGHEISHLIQGPRRNRYSIQAEMYAQFVGGQIYLDLGNQDFTSGIGMDSFSIELLIGGKNPIYPYNPFTEEGLKAAQKHLSSAQGGFVYKLLPVKSKTLTQDWLNHLSVSWYKTETWYIDYQLNSRPR